MSKSTAYKNNFQKESVFTETSMACPDNKMSNKEKFDFLNFLRPPF
jgi:hypothetical protein